MDLALVYHRSMYDTYGPKQERKMVHVEKFGCSIVIPHDMSSQNYAEAEFRFGNWARTPNSPYSIPRHRTKNPWVENNLLRYISLLLLILGEGGSHPYHPREIEAARRTSARVCCYL